MIGTDLTVTGAAAAIAFGLLLLGIIGSFVRMVRGPSFADRVVALDMITVLMVGFAGVYVVATGRDEFLDVAVVIGLIGFLGTVAFARYAERQNQRRPDTRSDGG